MAQPGSALAWGARGREFESRRPDQSNQTKRSLFGVAFLFYYPHFLIPKHLVETCIEHSGLIKSDKCGRASFTLLRVVTVQSDRLQIKCDLDDLPSHVLLPSCIYLQLHLIEQGDLSFSLFSPNAIIEKTEIWSSAWTFVIRKKLVRHVRPHWP